MSALYDSLSTLGAVALGARKAELIIRDCQLFHVYTGEVVPGTQVAVSRGRIAYVGPDASHTIGPGTKVIDAGGMYACPGLADPHLHIDQFVLPSEFARKALLCGVTSLFSDPIDVVSVAGRRGFDEFLRLGRNMPIRVFHMVPGGLPVDPKFSRSRTMTLAEERSALKNPDVRGMGEVFSWTKVTLGDPRTAKSIKAMLKQDCPINGHTAGASGNKLNSYVSSGIMSCHEPIDSDQALERLRLGMWVMVREGSIRRDLADIVPRLLAEDIRLDRLMFCSDGLTPSEIVRIGHMDHCIREAVGLGMNLSDAIAIASRNSFAYYGMERDLGVVAPGRLADLVLFKDPQRFRPDTVVVGGQVVVSCGRMVVTIGSRRVQPWTRNTVRIKKVSPDSFAVPSKKDVVANTIFMQSEIVTRLGSAELKSDGAHVGASQAADVWKVAAFDRTRGTGRRSVGFLENFGAEIGAFASTWSFHENDMIVVGSNDSDMALAANHLAKSRGGMAVVESGRVLASMRLQFAGIVSTDPFEKVAADFEAVNGAVVDRGCKFERPHLLPLFLPFLALPSVRILSGGMVDVRKREYIKPFKSVMR